jgi:hypothetical protein
MIGSLGEFCWDDRQGMVGTERTRDFCSPSTERSRPPTLGRKPMPIRGDSGRRCFVHQIETAPLCLLDDRYHETAQLSGPTFRLGKAVPSKS